VLEAVLFDWGGTLAEWNWSDELHEAGHRAGLAAIGRPFDAERTRRFREDVLPLVEERDYRELVRGWLAPVGDDELQRFLEAEYEAWRPGHAIASTTVALLEALRARGLKTGLVSNGFDPPDLVRAELARLGVAQLLDAIVMAGEAGVRKPDPAIFRVALDALGVEPQRTLMVGDSIAFDIAGAAALGMHTCQALWFVADDAEEPEPDFRAFTQMDVLTAVMRLGVVSPA
jgi:putative hydrolase of the HAD superfamily